MHDFQLRQTGVLVLTLLTLCSPCLAQKALQTDRLTQGDRVLIGLEPLIQSTRNCVVQVRKDNQMAALGTVVSADGLIVTKASEIDPLQKITVQRGRETISVKVLSWSEPHDLAILKAEGSGWTPVLWSQESDPAVGQLMVSVGTDKLPAALGIVSVPRRALPRDQMHGVLGIELEMNAQGAVIRNIFDNSAAALAGMQIGDQVTRVGVIEIESRQQLIEEIHKHLPGETVTVEIRRNTRTLHLAATLSHPFGDFLSRIAQQNRLGGRLSTRASGFPAVIQHDTVLKPEECGGPVLDLEGRVVGLNIARSGRTESLMIPVSVIQEVLAAQHSGQLPRMPSSSPKEPPPPPVVRELGAS